MKRIAMLVPYFGTFPNYFPLWLQSCGCNPDMDFLIFTDDRRIFDWPKNVKVVYLSWEEMRKRIKGCFDFPVKISQPYKLCDYRPAFGEIFERELEGYDFWGHCDLDVIWGALREFVSEDLLERYDKLFYRGHFSLYRNTDRVNRMYRCPVDGMPLYREVFQDENSRIFDEWTGIDRIFDGQNVPIYDAPVVADIVPRHFHFVVNSDKQDRQRPQVFLWRKEGAGEQAGGRIYRYYRDQSDDLVREEFMYIHLQKRGMGWPSQRKAPNAFLIVSNQFVPCQELIKMLDDPESEDELAEALIRKFYRKRPVRWALLRIGKRLSRKVKKALSLCAGIMFRRRDGAEHTDRTDR